MKIFLITAMYGALVYTYAIRRFSFNEAMLFAEGDNPMADSITVYTR